MSFFLIQSKSFLKFRIIRIFFLSPTNYLFFKSVNYEREEN